MTTPHTKERILDAAEELMWEKSFHSVGLNEILKAVGVPKGSFYHYFESKEHFGVELLNHYFREATHRTSDMLLNRETEADPMKRLVSFLEESIARFRENNGKCPCLVLKLASEVTSLSEPMRKELAKGFKTWLGILSEVFEEAKLLGMIPSDMDSSNEAGLMRDLWAGAIQRATVTKSTAPMENALACIRDRIVAHKASCNRVENVAA
jgi:TetR/AcrR family transcriptional repressor of nem operon